MNGWSLGGGGEGREGGKGNGKVMLWDVRGEGKAIQQIEIYFFIHFFLFHCVFWVSFRWMGKGMGREEEGKMKRSLRVGFSFPFMDDGKNRKRGDERGREERKGYGIRNIIFSFVFAGGGFFLGLKKV